MMEVKTKAWTIVGKVWPTLSVPGMIRSGTILRRRKMAVVVANDPIPNVSKKFVMAPRPIWKPSGKRASVAGDASLDLLGRTRRTAWAQPTT